MKFEIDETIEILARTPDTLTALLRGVSPDWTGFAPSETEWSVFDVVGHLVHGEKTDWIPRARIILAGDNSAVFDEFDRFAQFEDSKNKTLEMLLGEFSDLRHANLKTLRDWNLTGRELGMRANHPEFGEVSLAELLATWVVHDLTHIRQIATILAKRYDAAVGPWKAYLSILK